MPEDKKRKYVDDDRRHRHADDDRHRKKHDDRDGRSDRDRKERRDRESDHRRPTSHRDEGDRRRRDRDSSRSPKRAKKEEVAVKKESELKVDNRPKEVIAEELKTKEVMYQAKMAIQERLKRLNMPHAQAQEVLPSLKSTAVLKPEEASVYIDSHMEKLKKINELKSRLPKALPNLSVAKTPAAALDTIVVEKPKPEVKPEPEPEKAVDFLDPRIRAKAAQRRRKTTFEFKEKGEYEKLANMQRNKARLEKLQSEISKAAQHTGISSAVKLALVTPSGTEGSENFIPDIEWWDEVVLAGGKGYDNIPPKDEDPTKRYGDVITELVEHPIQLKPPNQSTQPQYIKACLTKKERKKLRRQNRREQQKEQAEKIRLGLEKPPEPKVKISNLMKVLGNEAIQDPTKMEAHVRKQIMERLQKHQRENEERKLTKEEKSAKKIRKIAEDTSLAVHVAIYKVKSLANPSKKFKVQMNAKQLQMTGVVVMLDDFQVIVVEGGQKQQRFYKNLMLNRIKWSDEIAGQKKDARKEDVGERNECQLIWEGIVSKRAFGEPRFVAAVNHKQAREIFDKFGVAHYWDLCYSTSVLLSGEDTS